MKPVGFKVPLFFRKMLYSMLAVSWLTGMGFFMLDRFFYIEGDFGPENHVLLLPMLTVHGASAFFMMILFGAMLFAHIPYTWRTGKLRGWGIALLSAVAIQIISAYLLYYLSNEFIRETTKWIHLVNGFLLPAVLTGHVLAAIRSRK